MKETNIIYYFDFQEIASEFLGLDEDQIVKFRIPLYGLGHFKEGDIIHINLEDFLKPPLALQAGIKDFCFRCRIAKVRQTIYNDYIGIDCHLALKEDEAVTKKLIQYKGEFLKKNP